LKYFKPLADVFFAFILCVAFMPAFLSISLVLLFNNKGRIFFTQNRGGFNNTIFKIYKFKTMNDRRDSKGLLLPDRIRLNRFGKFLRKYSLDEIPQFFNILRGEMSIVGPRPFIADYLEVYSSNQKRRHHVKPGITGLAQVYGRNSISWNRKIKFDLFYVDNVNFCLDLMILFKTCKKIFKSEDVNSSKNATMPIFNGKN